MFRRYIKEAQSREPERETSHSSSLHFPSRVPINLQKNIARYKEDSGVGGGGGAKRLKRWLFRVPAARVDNESLIAERFVAFIADGPRFRSIVRLHATQGK